MRVPQQNAVLEPRELDASFWRETLAPYAKPTHSRSAVQMVTSIGPYLAIIAAMYWTVHVSLVATLLLAFPAGGFAMRVFIIFHDCGHGSFFANRRANTWVGIVTGLLTYSTYHPWRQEHAVHHATSGDLDHRGAGDVDTWTVDEYFGKSAAGRLGYRLFRSPLVMFGLGPLWVVLIEPRFFPAWSRARFWKAILATNVAIACQFGVLIALFGWQSVLIVQLSVIWVGGAIGISMVYIQHQFEGVYWQRNEDWNYAESALRGSSYCKLPRVLQFFTGNIGFHHVHHLASRIPNYNLSRAHRDIQVFHTVPEINVWQSVMALRLKLYDEVSGRLVTFGEAGAAHQRRASVASPIKLGS
jgi:acyl-lipid omega-6 desaturase (Delta-12 desaturase)